MSLKIRVIGELLLIILLVIVLEVAIILSPAASLRIIFGLPFIFFFPGYALVAALFPRRRQMDGVQRIALSFGLSIALVTIIGLILNSISWGIKLQSILWTITPFIFILLTIALLRRNKLPNSEVFTIGFSLLTVSWQKGIQNRVLSFILVLTIMSVFGMVGYYIAQPRIGQKFTEFYILGSGGMITDYPRELKSGEKGMVTIGIVNHEYATQSYRVEVRINGEKDKEIAPIVLQNGKEWTQEVSFMPRKTGGGQRVEFMLFLSGDIEPYLEALSLQVNVLK